MPPLPKERQDITENRCCVNLGLPLAPPLGELAKPKALTERVRNLKKPPHIALCSSFSIIRYYSSICFARNAAATFTALSWAASGWAVRSSVSRPTLPVTSPAAMMGTAHSSAGVSPHRAATPFRAAIALVGLAAVHQLFQRLAHAAVGQIPPARTGCRQNAVPV